MGLFDRVSRVVRSNLNSVVSAAEDPEKILEQTVIDMQEDLVQMRQAVAQAIASQKRLEQQYRQNQQQATEWERRAKLALTKGDEALALEALNRKKTAAETAMALKTQLDQTEGQVKALKTNMTALESKIAEAKTKKEMLTARARAAKASEQIHQAVSKVGTSSAMAAFDRMEDKVMQLEARSEAIAELSTDSLESQFAQLEASSDVVFQLEELKAQMALEASAPAGALPSSSTPVDSAVDAQVVDSRPMEDPELVALREQLNNS